MTRARMHIHQDGVAIITALLLTTLAITIVASLFWQQQVQVRSIENQRLQLQKQWILRGAIDWAILILREDEKNSPIDHLGEPWAVPLAETRLDEYVDKKRGDSEASDAVLSGSISDAWARYNLTNMATNGVVNAKEVAVLRRLLTSLQLNPALAQVTADTLAATQKKVVDPAQPQAPVPETGNSGERPMGFEQVEDLLAVPGVTPDILAKLRNFVILLPYAGPINVNTAPAEVLAARIDTLSLADATALIASRDHAYFRDEADFRARLPGKDMVVENVSTNTSYFLVNGKVRLSHAALEVQALVERNVMVGGARIIWIKEN